MRLQTTYVTKDVCGFTKPQVKKIRAALLSSIKEVTGVAIMDFDYPDYGGLDPVIAGKLSGDQVDYLQALAPEDVDGDAGLDVVFTTLARGYDGHS